MGPYFAENKNNSQWKEKEFFLTLLNCTANLKCAFKRFKRQFCKLRAAEQWNLSLYSLKQSLTLKAEILTIYFIFDLFSVSFFALVLAKTKRNHAEVRLHDVSPIITRPGWRRALSELRNDQWALGVTFDHFILCSVSDAVSRTPHNRKIPMFNFLFTSHEGLSIAEVVSGKRFLVSDVTHVVNCKR